MDKEIKSTFSAAFFSVSMGHTMVIIDNRVFVIEVDTNEIRSLLSDYIGRTERYFSVISSILFDRSGLQVAKNFNDYLDLKWLIRIHQKKGEC